MNRGFSSSQLIADPYFGLIKNHILRNSGLFYYSSKDIELASRLIQRMKAIKYSCLEEYYTLLTMPKQGEVEFDHLMTVLTIGETYFFRNKNLFKALENYVFPSLFEKKRSLGIRIWSAGSATGEEAYSLGILLKEKFASQLKTTKVSIIGTDVNRHFIARAIQGEYSDWSFRDVDPIIIKKYFIKKGLFWYIKETVKENISFEYHNMVGQIFPSVIYNLMAFDLILCRNVMIYFSQDINKRLMTQFKESLVDNGYLLIGHAEHNPGYKDILDSRIIEKTTIYTKMHSDIVKNPEKKAPVLRPPLVNEIRIPEPFNLLGGKDFPPSPEISDESEEIKKLMARGEWDIALARCDKNIKNDRLNPIFYFFAAIIREQERSFKNAENFLNKAIYLDRKNLLAHYHMGLLMQNMGEVTKAKKSFTNVLTLLSKRKDNENIKEFEDITAGQLKKLVQYNLEVVERVECERN